MKKFLKIIASAITGSTEKTPEVKGPEYAKIRLVNVKKTDKLWLYDFAKDEVSEIPHDGKYAMAPKGVGPLVRAMNESNALKNGRKLHAETLEKHEALSKAISREEKEDGSGSAVL